ncbi:MAG: hypothetical protein OXI54_05610 [Chloroflexota bacterium]|nr:hypothetical protein [Chloroflexota bacterium]MDE2683609.1 hypothetical protein [Chloroflexota bacterium]
MPSGEDHSPSVGPRAWSLMRGRVDGERWASNHAEPQELIAWADIGDFEHYMGQMPFLYDNARAVEFYEAARSDAATTGMTFTHREYAGGFLQSVYETLRAKLGLDP